MRVSKEAKAASRARIIDEAARLFREHGIEATGVAQVMTAAGMTHGGFYRHFSSKDQLVCAGLEKAADDIASSLQKNIAAQGAKAAVTAFVEQYLSEQHVLVPGNGCPVAALGAEASRGPELYRQSITHGAEQLIELLSTRFAGSAKEVREKATRLLVSMVGTIVLARSAGSSQAMEEFLQAGRQNALGLMDT